MYKLRLLQKWLTISEAIKIIDEELNISMIESQIYRYAQEGKITLSLYFQSPIILKKTCLLNGKVAKKALNKPSAIKRICMGNTEQLPCPKKSIAIADTESELIYSSEPIWDIPMLGSECIAIQKLLAHSLSIPSPVTGQYSSHCGILVTNSQGEILQLYKKESIQHRLESQLKKIVSRYNHSCFMNSCVYSLLQEIEAICQKMRPSKLNRCLCFPLYRLPSDAFFIIQRHHLEKFIAQYLEPPQNGSRITMQVARYLWLACKFNPNIDGTLIHQPYKLLSLFEIWAQKAGINDTLNGDTLKKALERGAPDPN